MIWRGGRTNNAAEGVATDVVSYRGNLVNLLHDQPLNLVMLIMMMPMPLTMTMTMTMNMMI